METKNEKVHWIRYAILYGAYLMIGLIALIVAIIVAKILWTAVGPIIMWVWGWW